MFTRPARAASPGWPLPAPSTGPNLAACDRCGHVHTGYVPVEGGHLHCPCPRPAVPWGERSPYQGHRPLSLYAATLVRAMRRAVGKWPTTRASVAALAAAVAPLPRPYLGRRRRSSAPRPRRTFAALARLRPLAAPLAPAGKVRRPWDAAERRDLAAAEVRMARAAALARAPLAPAPPVLPAGSEPRIVGGAADGWQYAYPVGYAVPLSMAPVAPQVAPVAPVAPRMAPAPTVAPREYPGPVLGYYRAGRFTPAAVAPECQYPGWPQGRGPGPCAGCADCDGGPV